MESCKMFICRLSWKTTQYREYFQRFRDRATGCDHGCAHGFGFFFFADPSVAVRAIDVKL